MAWFGKSKTQTENLWMKCVHCEAMVYRASVEQGLRYEHLPLFSGRLELIRAKRWLSQRWQAVRKGFSLAS